MSNKKLFNSENRRRPQVRVLTAVGGALGIVGVAGAAASRLLEHFFVSGTGRPGQLRVEEARFGRWRHAATGEAEPVVLVRTAPDCWELHAHGGRAVAESIVSGLCAAGGGECPVDEWPGAPEGIPVRLLQNRLAQAGGWRAAQILSRQLAGRFDAEIRSIEQLIATACPSEPPDLLEARRVLQRLRRAARIGQRLPTPWRVVLRGAVNVGKSSLVNALAGYARSLVSPLAGTTRDLLQTRLVLDGWEIELVDTAGEQQHQSSPPTAVEQVGIERGRTAAHTADLVLELIPVTELVDGHAMTPDGIEQRVAVATKADLLPPGVAETVAGAGSVILTSALTGTGIDRLAETIIRQLVPEAAAGYLDHGVPVTAEQLQQVEQLQLRVDQLLKPRKDLTPGSNGPEPGA